MCWGLRERKDSRQRRALCSSCRTSKSSCCFPLILGPSFGVCTDLPLPWSQEDLKHQEGQKLQVGTGLWWALRTQLQQPSSRAVTLGRAWEQLRGSSWFGGIACSASFSEGLDRVGALQFIRHSLMLWEAVLAVIRTHHITGTSIVSPDFLPLSQGSQPAQPPLDISLSLFSQDWGFLLREQGVK